MCSPRLLFRPATFLRPFLFPFFLSFTILAHFYSSYSFFISSTCVTSLRRSGRGRIGPVDADMWPATPALTGNTLESVVFCLKGPIWSIFGLREPSAWRGIFPGMHLQFDESSSASWPCRLLLIAHNLSNILFLHSHRCSAR